MGRECTVRQLVKAMREGCSTGQPACEPTKTDVAETLMLVPAQLLPTCGLRLTGAAFVIPLQAATDAIDHDPLLFSLPATC